MKRSTKIQAGILAGVVIAVGAGILAIALNNQPAADQRAPTASTVVAENSHRLDVAENSDVTFTEFLDFECEVCGAVYPVVEELREEYAGRVTFVTRYFPLPGHFNSRNAAIAVEAAAQQGKFEEMYHRMFETQAEWGEQQVSAADRFREFAEELELDLDAYDDAVANPATDARVQQDFDAATALGATGTPTIFINDEYIPLTSPDDLRKALDAALSEQ
ncbi:protein-disulfide isomerase [Agromyces hippuratus]|uniref:Protein-disulfide isomerase n=1 Tax=Agromyces hippuratus TaxID=286438 RepID=A0A852WPW6_9MICO|nr:thioredoxin domain-containing protein [Agromyces hippuratus]NYG20019.1 protein-disulfide isomerase [Agromyces hippuratus]